MEEGSSRQSSELRDAIEETLLEPPVAQENLREVGLCEGAPSVGGVDAVQDEGEIAPLVLQVSSGHGAEGLAEVLDGIAAQHCGAGWRMHRSLQEGLVLTWHRDDDGNEAGHCTEAIVRRGSKTKLRGHG